MGNDQLRKAMAEAGRTTAQLATVAGVDAKTVERWLNVGRLPHPQARYAVALDLGVDEMVIWPDVARAMLKHGPDREVLQVFPTHSSVPDTIWRSLINDASREIMLCGYAPYWLTWQVPNLPRILREKAEAGCTVRAIIGDPDTPLVAQDEAATGSPLTLTARIAQARHMLEPLRELVQVRQTGMGFGRSVYRGDDQAMVDLWLHGQNGVEFPALHLRRRMDKGLFDQMAVTHAEALWETATPVW